MHPTSDRRPPPAASGDAGRTGTPAQVQRRFARAGQRAGTPLHRQVALALSGSDEAARALNGAGLRDPPVVLAALHALALAGRAPVLAAAHDAGDGGAAARAAVDTVVRATDEVVAAGAGRRVLADATGHGAVLHPAVAEAARRAGAGAVGLVDLCCGAGFDLDVDRVGITYDGGPVLGDPSSPVQVRATVRGARTVPARGMPEVVARVGVDLPPLDPTDPDDARWLRACVPPDEPARAARLEAELALAVSAPRALLQGDAVERLPDAVARVPADALPVVLTTWALSSLPTGDRARFLRRLEGVAAGRAVAWVSVEGVGVAPAVPTLGDRPASGHSIVGVTLLDGSTLRAEAVGRCWGRGRWLSWLGDR